MKTEDQHREPAAAEDLESGAADYKVGYGKPPVYSQFQKGKSGNPRGSTRKEKPGADFNRAILEEGLRLVTVRQGNKMEEVPVYVAIARCQFAKALKGSGPAQRAALNLIKSAEGETTALGNEFLKVAIQYKYDQECEIKRRKAAGSKDVSDIIPHPDNILIDMDKGTVHIVGELNSKDHAKLRQMGLKR
jgi:hypothetical protein